MRRKRIFVEVTTLLIIVLFLHTAISKFTDFPGFRHDMNNQPFDNIYTPFLIWAIPLTEILITVLLVIERFRLFGLYAAMMLMLAFSVYTAAVLTNAFEYIPCSCGGFVRYLSWKGHLFFNIFFVIISGLSIIICNREGIYRHSGKFTEVDIP